MEVIGILHQVLLVSGIEAAHTYSVISSLIMAVLSCIIVYRDSHPASSHQGIFVVFSSFPGSFKYPRAVLTTARRCTRSYASPLLLAASCTSLLGLVALASWPPVVLYAVMPLVGNYTCLVAS